MTNELKNILRVAFLYVTTVIGAGFASGQEIIRFFSSYRTGGFYGIITAGILFSLIGYFVLDRVYNQRIRSYDEFLFPSTGWLIGKIMEVIVILFQLSLFCVMLAGMGSILYEKLGLKMGFGVALMAALCMFVLLARVKGLVLISTVVAPVMIIGITGIGLYIICCKDISVFSLSGCFNVITNNWFFSSILYVSYNSITSVVLMCSMLDYLKTRRTAAIGGVLGGLILMFIAIILNCVINIFFPEKLIGELPLLNIVDKYSSIVAVLYTVVLWLAMFSSAVASGFCFIDRISSILRINYVIPTIVFCTISIPLSGLGFANLIGTLYPIFGYLGLFMVVIILLQGFQTIYIKSCNRR